MRTDNIKTTDKVLTIVGLLFLIPYWYFTLNKTDEFTFNHVNSEDPFLAGVIVSWIYLLIIFISKFLFQENYKDDYFPFSIPYPLASSILLTNLAITGITLEPHLAFSSFNAFPQIFYSLTIVSLILYNFKEKLKYFEIIYLIYGFLIPFLVLLSIPTLYIGFSILPLAVTFGLPVFVPITYLICFIAYIKNNFNSKTKIYTSVGLFLSLIFLLITWKTNYNFLDIL
jgi:hypothetical protein